MTPITLTLQNGKKLMVIPDTVAHLNGHAILTLTYSIFADDGDHTPQKNRSRENTLHLDRIDDPSYYGFITFEKPGQLFTYNGDGELELTVDEVEEIIESLSRIRDNSALWASPDSY
jgi:hypothetical protein